MKLAGVDTNRSQLPRSKLRGIDPRGIRQMLKPISDWLCRQWHLTVWQEISNQQPSFVREREGLRWHNRDGGYRRQECELQIGVWGKEME